MTTRMHEYKSAALPGSTLKWKKDGFWSRGDWVCEDQNKLVVAIEEEWTFDVEDGDVRA